MEFKSTNSTIKLQLGEGCIWDAFRNQIHYVDIEKYIIYSYSLDTGHTEMISMEDYIGCIILEGRDSLVAAVRNKLIRIDLVTKEQTTIMELVQPEYMRFNDGKKDSYGNLWIGTMAIDQLDKRAIGAGKLYCIKDEKVITEYEGFTIPNGLTWDETGTIFYHIDTPTRKIDVYDVRSEGIIENRRVAVLIEEKDGYPDGMCMDKRGNLWVAMWEGYKVNCYNPQTGKKIKEVKVPDKNVTCCVIGGMEQNILFVTTAMDEHGKGGNMYSIALDTIK